MNDKPILVTGATGYGASCRHDPRIRKRFLRNTSVSGGSPSRDDHAEMDPDPQSAENHDPKMSIHNEPVARMDQ
jgi:hypothetical protein